MSNTSTKVCEIARTFRQEPDEHTFDKIKLVRICTGLGLKESHDLVKGINRAAPKEDLIAIPRDIFKQICSSLELSKQLVETISTADDVKAARTSIDKTIEALEHLHLGDNHV